MNETIKRLKEYVETDKVYQDYKNDTLNCANDFDKFCIQHCKDIEELVKYQETILNRIRGYYCDYLKRCRDVSSSEYAYEKRFSERDVEHFILKVLVDMYMDNGEDDENRLIYHGWDVVEPAIELILENNFGKCFNE